MKEFNSMLRGTAYAEHEKIKDIKEGEDLVLKYGDNPEYPNAVSVWYYESKLGELKQEMANIMSERIIKVNELIKHKLSEIIQQHIELPNDLLATVTTVETSKDLKHAKAWVSVLPFDRSIEVVKLLDENLSLIHKELGKNVEIKYTPKVRFEIDTSEEKAAEIDGLIRGMDCC